MSTYLRFSRAIPNVYVSSLRMALCIFVSYCAHVDAMRNLVTRHACVRSPENQQS